jgi:hypothetical protein
MSPHKGNNELFLLANQSTSWSRMAIPFTKTAQVNSICIVDNQVTINGESYTENPTYSINLQVGLDFESSNTCVEQFFAGHHTCTEPLTGSIIFFNCNRSIWCFVGTEMLVFEEYAIQKNVVSALLTVDGVDSSAENLIADVFNANHLVR